MKYVYKLNNVNEAEALHHYIDTLKYSRYSNRGASHRFNNYPYCIINTEARALGGNSEIGHYNWCNSNPGHINITFQEIFDGRLEKKEFVEVELNEEHTAKVFKDKIVIGCQTFPTTIIPALAAAHATMELD